jgi:hypothetical protein
VDTFNVDEWFKNNSSEIVWNLTIVCRICLFIYGSFNEAAGRSDYIALSGWGSAGIWKEANVA